MQKWEVILRLHKPELSISSGMFSLQEEPLPSTSFQSASVLFSSTLVPPPGQEGAVLHARHPQHLQPSSSLSLQFPAHWTSQQGTALWRVWSHPPCAVVIPLNANLHLNTPSRGPCEPAGHGTALPDSFLYLGSAGTQQLPRSTDPPPATQSAAAEGLELLGSGMKKKYGESFSEL